MFIQFIATQMQNNSQNRLQLITNKHLRDPISDQLYQPFRDVAFQLLMRQGNSNRIDKSEVYQQKHSQLLSNITKSRIPNKLNSLQYSSEPINPFKKFIKIGEKAKQYGPIEAGVFQILQRNRKTEKIVYKYAEKTSNLQANSQKSKFRCVTLQKRKENEINFRQKFNKIKDNHIQKPKYNAFSVIDGPVNALIKGNMFFCGDCSNQLKARQRQLIYQFEG